MLNRIDLRFDQKRHTEANHAMHERPHKSNNRFDTENQIRFTAAEPQPFVDCIKHTFKTIHESTENINDQRDQSHDKMHTNSIPGSTEKFSRQFFGVTPQSRIQHEES